MPDFEDLLAIAYKADMVLSRRLQKQAGLTPCDALTQVLLRAAGSDSLEELVLQRKRLLQHTAHKHAIRQQARGQAYAAKKLLRQPDASAWLAWFDSSVYPNPGRMGIGGVLKSPDGRTIQISRAAGHGSSSDGEYLALIAVLQEAVRQQPDRLTVYGDSQVVINDVMQTGGSGASGLAQYRAQARALMTQLKSVTLAWIPRHRNTEADALSQQARQTAVANEANGMPQT
ncbi:ribonuclease HI family protein [Undibacterium sp.]|uniref:ribonuclease HI family protein n=1 Tax=Undibacterium sp. TaxID=1914977 RepID=UPI00374C8F92